MATLRSDKSQLISISGFSDNSSAVPSSSWMSECISICSQLRKRIKQGCSMYDPETVSTPTGSRRTTVGIMVDGLVIDNMVIGGPAHNNGHLDRGDRIIAVDSQPVSEETLPELLIGDDIPSSTVTLTVIKAGSASVQQDVVLTRMAVDSIADRCRMFDLFASMKVRQTPNLHKLSILAQNIQGEALQS